MILDKFRHEDSEVLIALSLLILVQNNFTRGDLIDAPAGQLKASGCPLEYHHDTRPSQGAHGLHSGNHHPISGSELISECYSDDEVSEIRLNPDEFFIFPSRKRVCQPNGTWWGAPPVCVRKIFDTQFENHNSHRFKHSNISECNDSKCPEANETWQRVGRLHSSCSSLEAKILNDSFEHLQVYAEFYQHVHLSYMTFNLADNSGRITRPFRVEVNVHPDDVIRLLSQESGHFLANHYDSFAGNRGNGKQNDICAITEIGAYTKRVLLRFYVEKTAESEVNLDVSLMLRWRQRPMFYGVNPSKQLGRGCPPPPSIPLGIVTDKEEDPMAITFACQPGYTLIDPVTKAPSNGRIECLNDLEWGPYPFPICSPSSKHNKQPVDTDVLSKTEKDADKVNLEAVTFTSSKQIMLMDDAAIKQTLRNETSTSQQKREREVERRESADGNGETTSTSSDEERDPMMFVMIGSLLPAGMICGFVCAFACHKLALFQRVFYNHQQVVAESDSRNFLSRLALYHQSADGYHVKGNRVSDAYTTISYFSSDSSAQSEHIYDRIDEYCDAQLINCTNNVIHIGSNGVLV